MPVITLSSKSKAGFTNLSIVAHTNSKFEKRQTASGGDAPSLQEKVSLRLLETV